MTYTNSLLQQILYLCIELPVSIALGLIRSVLCVTTQYLSERPLMSWIHHIFFSIKTRFSHIQKLIASFSQYTSQMINQTITFTRLLLITIIASAIQASKNIHRTIKQANFREKLVTISMLPVFWAQQFMHQFNVDQHGQPIIDQHMIQEIQDSIRQFFAFMLRLIVSTALLCIPLPYNRHKRCSRNSLILRLITATSASLLLWIVLTCKKQIIGFYMPASSHFLISIMLSVTAISIWIAPDKQAHHFLTITLGSGLFICWLSAPIVFALS